MVICEVLRIGHRPERDKRITTHVALTARAFGATRISFHRVDSRIVDTVSDVGKKFGGDFEIKALSNPKNFVKKWEGTIVHLTMFGISIDAELTNIKNSEGPLLFIVGAEKVPPWVFEFSDYNIAIGNQPHSEVAALSIALSKISDKSYNQTFEGGQLQVIPSDERRNMVETKEES
ncbi:MAG TPA: tRNA (cytidine(56)-2'-O)-methyltransferase [Candidatus Poseidoniia archaeon]|jgi:tRNA (cytidine56-2'-O)-methyltransferase|nr:tRNA (cytidine(56)-2'-O)-methyltransferase [Candidatus Poseidoniia archaeon]|tara:strand:+ start:2079 stop:2606 length:528 start_codon:yes stop_codon:yes gene_type:complete